MYQRKTDFQSYASYGTTPRRTGNPRRRKQYVTVDEMIASLHRANTSTGRKAVLWSKPHTEYERDWRIKSQIQLNSDSWRSSQGNSIKKNLNACS